MTNPSVPGYWMNETSGVLKPVVLRYLQGAELEPGEVRVMRVYLRQWINGAFAGEAIDELRRSVERIATNRDLRTWLDYAYESGVDPL